MYKLDMSGKRQLEFGNVSGLEKEWLDWYRLTPQERWRESEKLWDFFLHMGGPLVPEPDSQSPLRIEPERRSVPADGRPGLRSIGRSGV
jgi:hypothetical protein